MHGMLSAAVMLAAFAAVALAAATSVVWVYRAAGASPQRSRPAPAGVPADAAGPEYCGGPRYCGGHGCRSRTRRGRAWPAGLARRAWAAGRARRT